MARRNPAVQKIDFSLTFINCFTMSDRSISHLPAADRTVFFVSDGTGITAETFGHSVLTQFDLRFKQIRLPFIDTLEKAFDALRRVNEACETDGKRPIVFSSL